MRVFQNCKLLAAAAAFFLMSSAAQAAVRVHIDISSQTMSVSVNGGHYAHWRVSTARAGYWTPRGSYRVRRMARMHYSRKYDNSPMPHSLFFKGGYAIHGTGYVRSLGRPASHGCIRLAPGNAARLFQLVRQYGAGSTRIVITN
jgi:lipoprotein-anchoring transpeptidase ErfK/SrfK